MFHFGYDPRTGILTVRVEGSWTLPEVERYGREAGVQFAQARKQAGSLRLLVDLKATVVLSQSVIEPLAKAGMQYSRPSDRVALVVNSTLMKLQMKRMIGDAPTPVFLSIDEAKSWLLTRDLPVAGAAH
jgi:hypothetical protein